MVKAPMFKHHSLQFARAPLESRREARPSDAKKARCALSRETGVQAQELHDESSPDLSVSAFSHAVKCLHALHITIPCRFQVSDDRRLILASLMDRAREGEGLRESPCQIDSEG